MAKKELKYPKMSGNGKNSPVIGNNGLMVEAGDNTLYLRQSMEIMNLPDIDIRDPEMVDARINEYFTIMANYDTKPTVAGLAMSLGISRQMLWGIRNNKPISGTGYVPDVPLAVTNSIKKAYDLMENLWENYMQNGKINPVTGIFLGKNNYGYQDKVEHVVTPNIQTDEYDAEDIKERYLLED